MEHLEPFEKPRKTRGFEFYAGIVLLGFVLLCCGVPNLLFRLQYGSWPADSDKVYTIEEGMTKQQVLDIGGPPHIIKGKAGGGERWYYWTDAYTVGYLGLELTKDGIVVFVWI